MTTPTKILTHIAMAIPVKINTICLIIFLSEFVKRKNLKSIFFKLQNN